MERTVAKTIKCARCGSHEFYMYFGDDNLFHVDCTDCTDKRNNDSKLLHRNEERNN
jgi:Zn ribbon nucleic-acid-binding protein